MGLSNDLDRMLSKKCLQLESFSSRISASKKSGLFYRFASSKRNSLLSKLYKLTRRVNNLKWQMKVAAVGGTMAALGNTQDAVAQSTIGPFVKQDRASNPLRYPLEGYRLRPTVVDLDNDGDYDIVVGGYYEVLVYENVGTNTNPKFNDRYLVDSGLSPLAIAGYGSPAFADLNGDGLKDLIVGVTGSVDRIQFFINDGGTTLGDGAGRITFTEQTGPWDNVAKTGNPFYGINSNLPGFDPAPFLIDYDGDGDMDVFIGHDYSNLGDGYMVHYYQNDGSNNFTQLSWNQESNITSYYDYSAVPLFADVDQDGQLDFIMGRQSGDVRFFKGSGNNNFTEQTGPWDPIAKTGNPLDGIDFGFLSAPAFADLDNDGDLDMVFGANFSSYKYKSGDNDGLNYFINQGNAVFEQQLYLENPFNGISVYREAAPVMVDIDGDGDLDVVLGAKYGGDDGQPDLVVYTNNNGVFIQDKESSLAQISLDGYNYNIKPVFVDIDNDGDRDLFIATDGEIFFYRNNEGTFEPEVSPIDAYALYEAEDISYNSRLSLAFIDVDGDGDLDAFIGSNDGYYFTSTSKVDFLENQGTPEVPNFVGANEPAPFDIATFRNQVSLTSVDIDSDGDLDIVLSETVYDAYTFAQTTEFRLFLNNADGTLTEGTLPVLGLDKISRFSTISLVDFDGDGDLDAFVGLGTYYNGVQGGIISYYKNDNPAAALAVTTNVLDYEFGSGPIVLDANLTLADQDNDQIIRATVTIQNFQPGDELLTFTTQAPVTGSFNTSTGVLILQGSAPLATYQSILRTVAYEYSGPDPGTRKGSAGKVKALTRTIAFAVLDADKTSGQSASRTVNVASQPKNPPVIAQSTLKTIINKSTGIDLNTIITDPDGNLDPLSFKVIPNVSPTPARVGNATIANGLLNIDYSGTDFAGIDIVTIEACDLDGLCASAELSIEVEGHIVVRNGMSPNGDGLNDYFRLENITSLGAQNKVSIFTRWGDKVFEMENYNNADRKFEGKSDSGKELSSGVYFYKIEFLNGQPELTGYLTIKR